MGDSLLPLSIVKVNRWMNDDESELYNWKINVVEDDRVEIFLENIHEEAPSIGCIVHDRHNSESCGSEFSYNSAPSYCDVAPRFGSPTSNMFPTWWSEQIPHPVSTHILSTSSTDETFDSTWDDLRAPKVEVLMLNSRSKKYALPEIKKVVIKIDIHNDKDKSKAMRALSMLLGIESLAIDMKDKKLTLIGEIDPVDVVGKLKKWHTEIVTVGPAKEEKKKQEEKKKEEGKKPEDKKKEKEKKMLEECRAGFKGVHRVPPSRSHSF